MHVLSHVPLFANLCTDRELKVGTRTDYFPSVITTLGLLRWCSGKESACQCRRHKRCGFNPWIGKIPWNRKWQPTPALLPGKFHGQRSLVGYSPWDCKELDMIEHTDKMHIHMKPLQFSSVQSLSRVQLFATPWTVARQAPLSMLFPRQQCWSGLPFPSPGSSPIGLPLIRPLS